MEKKKLFFTKHAKSSAVFISIGIHALLIIMAFSFVAVTVIHKADQSFEAKPVVRPKMQLKKLQVPVNIKKVQRPKLRQRIVAKPKMNQALPDIKMPEISGVLGGLGSEAGGMGGADGIGFSMPEINLFGARSKGDKVFILLDSSDGMLRDTMGGIPAYTIIKDELVKLIDGLPSSALFNIAVFDKWNTFLLFPKMVPATETNVAKAEQWLRPLNAVNPGRGKDGWGPRTLGPGGMKNDEDLRTGDFRGQMESWHRSAMLAMKQRADAVFLLTRWWGYQRYPKAEKNLSWWNTSDGKRFSELYGEAVKLYEEENRKRKEQGQPPRVLDRYDKTLMVRKYFPGAALPPEPPYYVHKPEEFIESMLEIRKKYTLTEGSPSSGVSRKKSRADFSFNVIRFVPTEQETKFYSSTSVQNFGKMTQYFDGDYRELKGLDAIKSSVSSGQR